MNVRHRVGVIFGPVRNLNKIASSFLILQLNNQQSLIEFELLPAPADDPLWLTHSTFAGVFGASDAGGTGVAGESNTGIGVHGKGGRLAGLFEGKVEVSGSLTVQGIDLISLVRQLQQRIDELEASRVTRGGEPTHRPATRPNIMVTELHTLASGNAIFTVTGRGFSSLGRIVFSIFNATTRSHVAVIGQVFDVTISTSTITAKGDGTLFAREQIQCSVGDVLSFSATDGRGDSNDMTGTLWSNTVTASVS